MKNHQQDAGRVRRPGTQRVPGAFAAAAGRFQRRVFNSPQSERAESAQALLQSGDAASIKDAAKRSGLMPSAFSTWRGDHVERPPPLPQGMEYFRGTAISYEKEEARTDRRESRAEQMARNMRNYRKRLRALHELRCSERVHATVRPRMNSESYHCSCLTPRA